ncbi:MAG: Fe-S cluster assembly protein SufD [Candidatus Kapabacteria bacterium]|nr:Fe-S cluster assembly protein SufD [Candidatus Kapabacteria bacterium]
MSELQIKTDFKTQIKNEFDKLQSSLNGSTGSEINLARKEAFDTFFIQGLPTLKSENWKYTNLTFLNKLELISASKESNVNDLNVEELYYGRLDSYKIYLVNGRFSKDLSDNISLQGLAVSSFNTLSAKGIGRYSEYFGKLTHNTSHPFVSVNTALSDSVLVIEIDKGVIIEKPLQIINITDSRENAVISNPRILIISGKSSSVKIVESNYTIGSNPGIKNIVKEFFLDDNAHLNYYKIQDDSEFSYTFDFTQANQKRDSHFDEAAISINGRYIRNDLRATLDGENIESHFYGLFIAGNSDFVDNHTIVDHAKPNCMSNENYRGIMFDKSTGVFNGKIMVRRDAQKTNAYQSNKNVLLSDNATINTKPELEIYADDVKCSHGATSGALDKTSLFYLRARGIDEKNAEIMLLNAFAAEVVAEIKIDELKELILQRIENKLNNAN